MRKNKVSRVSVCKICESEKVCLLKIDEKIIKFPDQKNDPQKKLQSLYIQKSVVQGLIKSRGCASRLVIRLIKFYDRIS